MLRPLKYPRTLPFQEPYQEIGTNSNRVVQLSKHEDWDITRSFCLQAKAHDLCQKLLYTEK